MIYKILLVILLCSITVKAQDFKVSLNKLTEETQQLSESPDNLKLVWWIPVEFWEAVFADDKAIPVEQANEILEVFKQYTMVATIDGVIGNFGDVAYKSDNEIFDTLSITDHLNNNYTPLKSSDIDIKTAEVIGFIKPVLSRMLGQMGDNMHFFLFQDKNNPGHSIIDPRSTNAFTVLLGGEAFTFKLPLGSLLKPKKCPIDSELLNGAWAFCPFHGKELISN